MAIIEALVLKAAAKGISKPLEDLYNAAKNKTSFNLDKYKNAETINNLYRKIDSIQKVKTLLSPDKEVKLASFYYPSKVIKDEKPITPNGVTEIDGRNFILQGTVGQGKSTLLRHLCIKELLKSNRIPIFFELRRIKNNSTLVESVIEQMKAYGLEANTELFYFYAEQGKILLLLDGFDELEEKNLVQVATELETLSQRHAALQIVVTSRPDSGIEHSPYFRIYKLAPLSNRDHRGFLGKHIHDEERLNEMLKSINESPTEIKELLSTPLLLTLLIFIYRAEQRIPSEVPEFYENLFQTLLVRHDRTKLGFRRKRHTAIGDKNIQNLFECFCFISKQKEIFSFSPDALHQTIQSASNTTNIKCEPTDFELEITKVACLLKQDGLKFYFIHKSVQEYYSAAFVAHSQEAFAKMFYEKLLSSKKFLLWGQELRFLEQIDKYRFFKYYKKVLIEESINAIKNDAILYFNQFFISFKNENKNTLELINIQFTPRNWPSYEAMIINNYVFEYAFQEIFKIKQDGILKIPCDLLKNYKPTNQDEEQRTYKLTDFLDSINKKDYFLSMEGPIGSKLLETKEKLIEFIEKEEGKMDLLTTAL